MKNLQQTANDSTCQKRITVTEIWDAHNRLLARESNRCNPSEGKCHRIGITERKENYPKDSECGWIHSEIMAIGALQEGSKPFRAVLYGHTFFCDACELALRRVGVQVFEVSQIPMPMPVTESEPKPAGYWLTTEARITIPGATHYIAYHPWGIPTSKLVVVSAIYDGNGVWRDRNGGGSYSPVRIWFPALPPMPEPPIL